MEEKRPSYIEQIPRVDWEKTTASAKKLVEEMGQQIESLEKQLAEVLTVQEQLFNRILSKLGVNHRTQAVIVAARRGIVNL
ncbi:transposase IS66 (plasmid) [Scytonema sp. HK-05]|nr:hypothetical protein NIES2130_24795 [Scytonema sp. HK-05]BAY50216.1 transposase IS66 [Scytonema sp. HK-05]